MQQLFINFDFISDFKQLSALERRQFGNFLYVEGLLEIKINGITYFYEEACLLLEFYLHLDKWLKKPFSKRGDFLYHTLELDEEEPFLAVLLKISPVCVSFGQKPNCTMFFLPVTFIRSWMNFETDSDPL